MVYEIYNEKNTYVTSDGNYITPADFYREHNVAKERPIAVGLYDRTIEDVKDFGFLKSCYGIYSNISDKEALDLINRQVALDITESSPIERIASALEYIVLHLMGREDNNELRQN